MVLGAGAAGLAAAIEARRRGAEVLVVDKQPEATAGGNTVVSGGVWFHHDDEATAARYLRSLCHPIEVRDDVVDTWARETARNTTWVRGLGGDVQKLAFHEQPEYPELDGSSCYQGYWGLDGVLGEGRLHRFLLERALDLGVRFRWEAAARRLLADDGAVTGVVLDGYGPMPARAVVLATGGFAGSAELVARHLGLRDAQPWGSPHCTGDGLELSAGVGAALGSLGNHMRLLGTTVEGASAGLPVHVPAGAGYLFVDDTGGRFVDESLRNCHGHVRTPDGYERFAAGPFWLVFDARALTGGPLAAPAPFGWQSRMEGLPWSEDNQAEVAMGVIRTAASWGELASQIDVPAGALEDSVASYHAARDRDALGRARASRVPLDEAPFAALRCTPLVAFTGGGPRRDGQARVLDGEGEPIDGLFAAGEVSATYPRLIDGGMMIADALAFGRVAGEGAASAVSR